MSVRKLFKTFCFFCITMMLFTTVGTSAWYFFAGVQKSQEATDVADYLRPNQIFGDGQDTAIIDMEYYDVYFLAQSVKEGVEKEFLKDTGVIMEEDTGKHNYEFKNASDHDIYFNSPDFGKDERYGKWENPAATSPYYWKYENISTVTASMLLKMGNPSCQIVDMHGYPCEFNSWICDPYIYLYEKDPKMSEIEKNGKTYIQVYGSYPFRYFEPAYFNMLLENYDSRAIYINGRKSLFFYPIYSTGKGYYALSIGNGIGSDFLRDSITITNESSSGSTSSQFVFDPTTTKAMHDIPNNVFVDAGEERTSDTTRYFAYRYTEYIVENSKVSANNGFIENDMDTSNHSWIGERKRLTYNNGTDVTLNNRVGRYNIYLFVKERYVTQERTAISDSQKESASFTLEQEHELTQLCLGMHNTHIYETFSCDLHQILEETTREEGKYWWDKETISTYYWNTRDYYVVIEKKYEPRLIGGPTGAFDWKNDISRQLTFVRGRNSSDSYFLQHVAFNCDDGGFGYNEYTVSTSLRKLKIPNYYFGLQISRDTNLVSNQNIGYDSDLTESKKYPIPMYKYYDADGVERSEEYQSNELLISIQNAINDDVSKDDLTKEKSTGNLKYDDINRIMVTQANASANPKYYPLREYMRKGINGEAGFEDYNDVVKNLVLIRPIQSGNYSLYTHINYTTDTNDTEVNKDICDIPESIDIWAFRKHNLFVNIYDPADFGGKELTFNGTYITGNDIKNYSFQCVNYYHLQSDLMYEEDNTSKQYKRNGDLNPSPIEEIKNASGNYDFYYILAYYDKDDKCLQDIVSGRYITMENYASNPFIIEKNYILQVVPNPYKKV